MRATVPWLWLVTVANEIFALDELRIGAEKQGNGCRAS